MAKFFDLSKLPRAKLDATDDGAETWRMTRLAFYDEGDTLEMFLAKLAGLKIDVEEFKQTATYLAAKARGEPEWINDL